MQWNNPKSTHKQIADYFSIFGELLIKHRTVEDIISNKEFPAIYTQLKEITNYKTNTMVSTFNYITINCNQMVDTRTSIACKP
jgi:hypothetical protein